MATSPRTVDTRSSRLRPHSLHGERAVTNVIKVTTGRPGRAQRAPVQARALCAGWAVGMSSLSLGTGAHGSWGGAWTAVRSQQRVLSGVPKPFAHIHLLIINDQQHHYSLKLCSERPRHEVTVWQLVFCSKALPEHLACRDPLPNSDGAENTGARGGKARDQKGFAGHTGALRWPRSPEGTEASWWGCPR